MTRVAAADLGTNSTRLLVADVDAGRLDEVVRRLEITRLGEAVDATGSLGEAGMRRVLDVLAGYREQAASFGVTRTLAVATSAVRDAANGAGFLTRVEAEGFETLLLDGEAEAALTFRGVLSGRAALDEGTLVLDIGGGSTELSLGGPAGSAEMVSLQAGCVRMTERFLGSDPPTRAELAACAAAVRALLPAYEPRAAIGVAGTVTTAAALDLGLARYDPELIHGHRLTADAIEVILARLAALPVAERARIPGLEPARAPVIVAGLVILREVLDAYRLGLIEASERDLLHGAALLTAER